MIKRPKQVSAILSDIPNHELNVFEISDELDEDKEEPYFVPMCSSQNGNESKIIKDPNMIIKMEEQSYLKPLLRCVL